jgi:hypothetical protein
MAEGTKQEERRTTPPTPSEFVEGNVSGRPGVALSVEKSEKGKETAQSKKVMLGPVTPVKHPTISKGWWK